MVFDGPEDYHRRIDDPSLNITKDTLLFMRGTGPIGYPGAAEVVNMRPPAYLIREGMHALPCIGDGRQSGTSASPSILNASPEAALGSGLALLVSGDRVRIDLARGTVDVLISETELAKRKAALKARGHLPGLTNSLAGNSTCARGPDEYRRHSGGVREIPALGANGRYTSRQPLGPRFLGFPGLLGQPRYEALL